MQRNNEQLFRVEREVSSMSNLGDMEEVEGMNKYNVTLVPLQETYYTTVEAETIEEAKELAEEEANQNMVFVVDKIEQITNTGGVE